MMHLRSPYFLLLAAPLLLTASLRAQALAPASTSGHQEVDLAVTYTAQHSNLVSNPTFWQQGGSVELSTQTYRGFGIAANISGTNVGNAANSSVGLSMVTYLIPGTGLDPTAAPDSTVLATVGKDQLTSQEQHDAEVRQAVRYERGLAVKMLIALGVVAIIVVIRLLVV